MFVAATTDCLPESSLDETIEKLAHLEFANIEIAIRENGNHLKPSQVCNDFEGVRDVCLSTQRLNVIGYSLDISEQGEDYFEVFTQCCRLAKATKGGRRRKRLLLQLDLLFLSDVGDVAEEGEGGG